ncbi:hypothetical protein GCM10023094_50670 [Rhodococcus olei]|uniref:Lipoprotein with Yx(FWY)xxD motif n=1 Tax=Rhodococcus olei TaxID=2161675 RepID=A0ABP8PNL5_9NOCA
MATKSILALAALGAAVTLAGGCGADAGEPEATAHPTPAAASGAGMPAPEVELGTRGTALGTVLTDGAGFTLYRFDEDTPTEIHCTGPCAEIWPPSIGTPHGDGHLPGTLGTMTRPDGAAQATYDGSPLYRFAKDTAPGQTTGDGVKGTWHVVTVDAAHG